MKSKNIFSCLNLIAAILILCSGCKKDPYKGVTSNERSIEAVKLPAGQIGPAIIDRTAGTVVINMLLQAGTDLTKIAPVVQASYKATVSPNSGQVVDFSKNNETSYTVTSESGKTRTWKVSIIPFTETLLGTYSIKDLVVYGGTGPEYGAGELMSLPNKPVWPVGKGPSVELDNQLTFTYLGATDDGKTFGKVVNDAGPDGLYADFVYTPKPQTDVNNFYRKIPKGESKWTRDYSANTITFTFSDGTTSVGTFTSAGTDDLGNQFKKIITDNSFVFALNGVDDWGNIYSDFDKLVSHPRKYWIDVKRKN